MNVIRKCSDVPPPAEPVTTIMYAKDADFCIVEFRTPELTTSLLDINGIPYQ